MCHRVFRQFFQLVRYVNSGSGSKVVAGHCCRLFRVAGKVLSPLFLVVFTLSTQAMDMIDRLVNQSMSGSASSISTYCGEYLRRELAREELSEERLKSLLQDETIAQFCFANAMCRQIASGKQKKIPAFKDREFAQFIFKTPGVVRELAFSRKCNALALQVIHQIWLENGKRLEGTDLMMALGAGLSLKDKDDVSDRLGRMKFYRSSQEQGKLFSQFSKLKAWEMAVLFQSGRNIEELVWAQGHTESKANFTDQKAGDTACGFIPYRMENKDGISIHAGSPFYDNKPQTLAILVEYGGVCGAVSTAACGFIVAKGIPGYTISQPGHCAFVWKGADGDWKIGNNIYGWLWSGNLQNNPVPPWSGAPYMIYAVGRFQGHSKFVPSWVCEELAYCSSQEKIRRLLLERSVKMSKWNVPAWLSLAKLKTRNMDKTAKLDFVSELSQTFGNEPVILTKLVSEGVGLQPDRIGSLKLAAFVLGAASSQEAQETYLKTFAAEAKKAIPEMADLFDFTVKTRSNYFERWASAYSGKKVPSSFKRKMCSLLEKAIPDVLRNESMRYSLLNAYVDQLILWKDAKYQERGIAFLKNLIQNKNIEASDLSVVKNFGVKLAEQLDSKKDIEFFQQKN